jgi:hypothetical protein
MTGALSRLVCRTKSWLRKIDGVIMDDYKRQHVGGSCDPWKSTVVVAHIILAISSSHNK